MAYYGVIPFPLTAGGTGTTPLADLNVVDGVVYNTGSTLKTTAVGTAGQVLTSNGAGVAPTFQAAGGGGGITTLAGNTGSATGATVTVETPTSFGDGIANFSGATSILTLNFTDANDNVGIGKSALAAVAGGGGVANCAYGSQSLVAVTTGSGNTAIGSNSGGVGPGGRITTASDNILIGSQCGTFLTSGDSNIGIGFSVFGVLQTGHDNLAIGSTGGSNLSNPDSSNILIQNAGVSGDSNTIRIGTQGAGSGQQNKCFVAGIAGVTVANNATVLISTVTGQLGTVASSRRYKENIVPMAHDSSKILDLQPVKFNYCVTPNEESFGLIAEDVNQIMPYLVAYNEKGQPETVRYHELPVLLLNELKKQQKRIEYLESKLVS